MKLAFLTLFMVGLAMAAADLQTLKLQYLDLLARGDTSDAASAVLTALQASQAKAVGLPKITTFNGSTTHAKNVCLVVSDFDGFYTKVSSELSRAGHQVTLLYTGSGSLPTIAGVTVQSVTPSDVTLDATEAQIASYEVYQTLKAQQFDVVFFSGSTGYYSTVAKKEGLAFPATHFSVGLTGLPTASVEERFMEKATIENADSVWANAEQLVQQTASRGITMKQVYLVTDKWAQFAGSLESSTEKVTGTPKVSVCITHYNRPDMLLQAIESVEAQDYENIEVVLVDDGSTSPEALALIDHLSAPFSKRGWKTLKTNNQYTGAARNAAAAAATGEYLFFLDDDNYARSNAVSTYVWAALNSKADILSAVHDVFTSTEAPSEIESRWIPLGQSLEAGAFSNVYGDSNFFVSKKAFNSIQFTEEYGVGLEDYEFYAEAAIRGVTQEVVPESLLWVRSEEQESVVFATNPLVNRLRSIRPYTQLVGNENMLRFLASTEIVQREAVCGDFVCNTTEGENCVTCCVDCCEEQECACPGQNQKDLEDESGRCDGNGTCVYEAEEESSGLPVAYCECDAGFEGAGCEFEDGGSNFKSVSCTANGSCEISEGDAEVSCGSNNIGIDWSIFLADLDNVSLNDEVSIDDICDDSDEEDCGESNYDVSFVSTAGNIPILDLGDGCELCLAIDDDAESCEVFLWDIATQETVNAGETCEDSDDAEVESFDGQTWCCVTFCHNTQFTSASSAQSFSSVTFSTTSSSTTTSAASLMTPSVIVALVSGLAGLLAFF